LKLSPTEYREKLIQDYQEMPYKEYLKSDWWQWIKKEKIRQVGYKCQKCRKSNKPLHIHHNQYKDRGKERLSDLSCLCKNCHDRKHLFWKPKRKRL